MSLKRRAAFPKTETGATKAIATTIKRIVAANTNTATTSIAMATYVTARNAALNKTDTTVNTMTGDRVLESFNDY